MKRVLLTVLLLGLSWHVQAQVCTETVTLNLAGCPAGATPCVSKGSRLSVAEGDANAVNLVKLCNAGGGSGAPTSATYLVVNLDGTLSAERTIGAGAGLAGTDGGANGAYTLATASTEAAFLTDGGSTSLTCGASNQGKAQVLDNGKLEYCDGAGTSVLQAGFLDADGSDDDVPEAGDFGALALTGDVTSSGLATMVAANAVALTTDTTGNYAAGDAEAGNATGLACTTCVDASDIAADAVTEPKLDFVDAPADEECATYEATGGRLEWQSCGSGGGGNSFETLDAPNGTDPVADSATDTLQLLDGDGIKITGDSAADSLTIAQKDPLVYADWKEEFCERNTTSNVHGKNWTSYGANAPGEIPTEANHPCIQSLSTTTTSGNTQALGMGKFGNTDNFKVSDHLDRAWFVIKTDTTITSMELRLGFMEDATSTTGGDGFFAEYDPSVSANWRCVTRQGGTSTSTASSVAVATSTWYQIEIERASNGDHKCYVNSATAFATHTTNLPTNTLQFAMAVETTTTAVRGFLYDFVRLRGKALGQRY